MQTFPGFRAGVSRHTPLPASFFSELLPLIDDLAELQLTLCCCRALAQKDAPVRYLRLEELLADENLLLPCNAARQSRTRRRHCNWPCNAPCSGAACSA